MHVPGDAATIQGALDASAATDTVEVADGVFDIVEPLTFRGKALTLRSVNGPASTTIRMGLPVDPARASVIVFESGETEAALLEGFTITGGLGTRWGTGSTDSGGGGVLSRNASRPTVRGCVITGNFGRNGGGLMCDRDSSIRVERCEISLNRASSFGGGIFWSAAGEGSVVEDCLLYRNFSASGGAFFCYDGSSPEIRRCRVESNNADSVAGGICCLFNNSPRITACAFIGNFASGGGAVSCESATDNPVITNCLLVANIAFLAGAVQARSGARPSFVNCTITANGASDSEGGIYCPGGEPRILNSIVQGNIPESICGEVTSTLSDADPGFVRPGEFAFERFAQVDVAGAIITMPDFIIDPGDYRLAPGSPAIDAGQAEGAPATDLAGAARPCGLAVDLGAYERCIDIPAGSFLRGDSNDSGRADISDAIFVLAALFTGGPSPVCLKSADSNDSGKVDVSDAVYLLAFLFTEGMPIPPPFESCGLDPTADDLTCAAPTSCVR